MQDDLVRQKFLKPSSDAALATKGQAKAKKAKKRAKTGSSKFRQFETLSGLQVRLTLTMA